MKTLKDLLNMAIDQEISSQQLYRKGLELTENKDAHALLKQLIEEEINHQSILEGVRSSGMYDPSIIIKDESVFERAVLFHNDADDELPKDLNIDTVFDFALKREFNAVKTFKLLANAIDHPELKTLLSNLAKEEENHHYNVDKHYKLIKGLMGKEI
jgi:rubrerythrin